MADHAYNHTTGVCDWCGAVRTTQGAGEIQFSCPGPKPFQTKLPFVAEHLHGLADLFAERNAVYKDNFRMVGKIMEAMFPDGIKLVTQDEHNKFHLFMLAIVKLSRYAINYEKGHKDSLDDLIVYFSMVAALDHEAAARLFELAPEEDSPNGQQA